MEIYDSVFYVAMFLCGFGILISALARYETSQTIWYPFSRKWKWIWGDPHPN
jgi:hypothetical protein